MFKIPRSRLLRSWVRPTIRSHIHVPVAFPPQRRYLSTIPAEDQLKHIFDNQKAYNEFNSKAPSKSVGLFQNEYLRNPEGLLQFSQDSLEIAKSLVVAMNTDVKSSELARLTYIRKLDQLSDVLCRVIDVAEFIRNTHPQEEWVEAAQQTHEMLFEYMNQLNTNVELYINLQDILLDADLLSKLTEEEINVGEYLKQDFEKSGIHMDNETRKNFVDLTQEISVIGANYSNGLHSLKSYWCEVDTKEFEKITNKRLKKEIQSYQLRSPAYKAGKKNIVLIPLVDYIPHTILTECPSESIRRKVWVAYHSVSDEQLLLLNGFLKYRAVLSRMLGYESFGHYQLQHKMAKSPDNVTTFLNKIQTNLLNDKKGLLGEIKSLYKYKEGADFSLSDEDIIEEVKPWDRDYLLNKLQQDLQKNAPDSSRIKEYLSVGTVMSGLNDLFRSIYNIELRAAPVTKGETWDNQQVRKIQVYDLKADSILGYLYIDFWSPKVFPSHFTVVCSRKLNTDIHTESKEELRDQIQLDETEQYQLPIISVVFNFYKPNSLFSSGPSLLTLEQVETVFHEMGHAMHSMIGKTDLQNLSGTRAVTDFVELPSVLMESFAQDPRVICKIGKHFQTGEPLPQDLFEQEQKQKVLLKESEIFMQSKMALMDQVLHNPETVEKISDNFDHFDSTPIYHGLESRLKVFADRWSTWHGKFLHLFSYGAVYYSYLLDRAIADKVYKELFSKDPWDVNAGTKYKESILKWGGTRDPWVCLADALDNDELRKGDAKSMEIIGSGFK